MRHSYSSRIGVFMLLSAVTLLPVLACQPAPGGTDNGDGSGNADTTPRLFVVDNAGAISSYSNAEAATGNVSPATNLINTQDQPIVAVVTATGQLLVGTEGGIYVYDNAKTVTANAPANRLVTGSNTLLNVPAVFALDAANDRLFVGNELADNGVLVFEGVSGTAFDQNTPPVRAFNPPDRSPSVFHDMPISAMSLDSAGALYVAEADSPGEGFDTTGYLPDRMLVFASPATASGPTPPSRTFVSTAWSHIADMAVHNDVLYVANDSDSILVFRTASTLTGDVTPDAVLTPPPGTNSVNLRGIVIASDGRVLLSDESNDAIYSFVNIAGRSSGGITPDTTISGLDTELFTPSKMFLLEP
jgi:hypothetical protein